MPRKQVYAKIKILPGLVLMAMLLCMPGAWAQSALQPLNGQDLEEMGEKEGLLSRDPFSKSYEPTHVGAFMVYPLLELKGSYNDNVYANDKRKTDDFINSVSPQLVVQKEYGRHFFELRGLAELQRGVSEHSEDIENYDTSLRANLEAWHDLVIPLKAEYKIDHADRHTLRTSQISKTPLRSRSAQGMAGIIYSPNRLKLSLIGQASTLRLDDGTDLITGAAITRDDADRNVYEVALKGSYAVLPNWKPYVQAAYHREDFLRGRFTGANYNGVSQDNTVWRTQGGLNFDYKGLLLGHIGAGVDFRHYDAASLDNTTDFAADADFTANFSRRTQLLGEFSQAFVTDNDVVTGLVSTRSKISLKHEMRPDMFITLHGGYGLDDFEASTREDDLYSGGLALQYISSPKLRLALEYDYEERDSNAADVDFSQNLIMLRLLGSL